MASYNLGRVKGAMWYAGTASADEEIKTELTEKNSLIGDLYLNTETGDVYVLQGESRETSEWVQTLNLKGPSGASGKTPNVTAVAGEHISDVGTPSVEASGSDEVTLTFDYLKGETGANGKDGAAAGFGIPSATASALGAEESPTVKVETSGENTEKVFTFSFGIPKGAAGAKGTDGATWATGSGAPEAASGKEGDLYFDSASCDVYKRGAEAWEKIGNIKGATGGKGENGADGKTPTFSLNENGELIATFEE